MRRHPIEWYLVDAQSSTSSSQADHFQIAMGESFHPSGRTYQIPYDIGVRKALENDPPLELLDRMHFHRTI